MTAYFEAPDGHGESTIWVRNPDRPGHPVAIIRSHDVHTHYWPDVVARMTGTTITTDDATVDLVAQVLVELVAQVMTDGVSRDLYVSVARAILAALTGVPHD